MRVNFFVVHRIAVTRVKTKEALIIMAELNNELMTCHSPLLRTFYQIFFLLSHRRDEIASATQSERRISRRISIAKT
jgi:hypothetical protein